MDNWIKRIEANAYRNMYKVLVGNNCDKKYRVISQEQGKKMEDKYGMNFFETSFRTNQNVNKVFNFLVQEILKSYPSYPYMKIENSLNLVHIV